MGFVKDYARARESCLLLLGLHIAFACARLFIDLFVGGVVVGGTQPRHHDRRRWRVRRLRGGGYVQLLMTNKSINFRACLCGGGSLGGGGGICFCFLMKLQRLSAVGFI